MWSAVRLYSETSGNSKAMAAKNAHPTMATVAISLSRRGSTRIVDADTVLPSLGNSLPALLNDTPLAHKCTSIKGLFTQPRRETVRKGVRVTLRARIWPVCQGQTGPFGPFWVPPGPAFRCLRTFSDSLRRLILGSSRTWSVGFVLRKRTGERSVQVLLDGMLRGTKAFMTRVEL